MGRGDNAVKGKQGFQRVKRLAPSVAPKVDPKVERKHAPPPPPPPPIAPHKDPEGGDDRWRPRKPSNPDDDRVSSGSPHNVFEKIYEGLSGFFSDPQESTAKYAYDDPNKRESVKPYDHKAIAAESEEKLKTRPTRHKASKSAEHLEKRFESYNMERFFAKNADLKQERKDK